MRAVVAMALAAVLAGACGGTGGGAPADSPPAAATPATSAPSATTKEPTPEQLAAREALLRDIESGKVKCWCTAAERARDRVARGLVEAPDERPGGSSAGGDGR